MGPEANDTLCAMVLEFKRVEREGRLLSAVIVLNFFLNVCSGMIRN